MMAKSGVFENVLQEGLIGGIKIRNRIVMPPMVTNYAGLDGEPTERMIEYYRARARGGVGLIIVEATVVSYEVNKAKILCRVPRLHDPVYIPDFNELVEAVKDEGAKIAIQLSPGGAAQVKPFLAPGVEPIAASAYECKLTGAKAREATIDEIKSLVEAQGKGALLAKNAGFDMVEIHAHGGYMMATFLSPYYNKRRDMYGGGLEGRMRFTIETIRCMKAQVGDDFPIGIRYAIDEHLDGGRGVEESKIIATRMEDEGISFIDVSSASYDSVPWIIPPMSIPRGCWIEDGAAIKEVVNIPVIVSGRLGDPDMAESVIKEGKADFVGIGRGLIADPELPNKLMDERPEDIKKCISCNGCLDRLFHDLHVRCAINPLAGRECEYEYKEIRKADTAKKVMVIGGGPAGMEAALTAAARGHDVVLYEKEVELGGQLNIASVPPHKEELKNIISYYSGQLKKSDVKVELGKEIVPEIVKKEKPDVVIVATGGKPLIPELQGVKSPNVVTAHDVLKGIAKVGEKVIVIGGGLVGCETAEYLADRGKSLIIVEMLDQVAMDVEALSMIAMMERLAQKRVEILTGKKVLEITDAGLRVIDKKFHESSIGGDTVVLAMGTIPVNEIEKDLVGKVRELYLVGDAKEPRRIMNAIYEGFRIGIRI